MTRRLLLRLGGALALPSALRRRAGAAAPSPTLLSAPLELVGDWNGSLASTPRLVVARAREVCLSGVGLFSDRQPRKLVVQDRSSGPPHIMLNKETPDTAYIVVDVGKQRWAQLAYQFGHELGHVACNSWVWDTRLKPPTHWLEEALVEAFSLRGLGLMADSWTRDPPIAGSSAYGAAFRDYRESMIEKYRNAGAPQPITDVAAWFHANRTALDRLDGLDPTEGPAIVALFGEFERDKTYVEDLGAINRWPQRSGVPIEEYLSLWQTSCKQVNAPGRLPLRLHDLFGLR